MYFFLNVCFQLIFRLKVHLTYNVRFIIKIIANKCTINYVHKNVILTFNFLSSRKQWKLIITKLFGASLISTLDSSDNCKLSN